MINMDMDCISITEIAGDEVTRDQIDMLCNFYYWVAQYCSGKDLMVS
jgi:hypothetical protein